MTTARRLLPFAAAVVLALGACGDDEAEASTDPSEDVTRAEVRGGPGDSDWDDDDCEAFCEKANECATAAGRRIPEPAQDCAVSCESGGLHRQAPASLHECSGETCGAGFEECTRRAVLGHMRDQDIAIFPPICQGLCEKAAWCHRHADRPLGPGEDDCEAACRPGGPFADLPDAEMTCVHYPCGGPFTTCRREGGPENMPPPAPPGPARQGPNQGPPGPRPSGGPVPGGAMVAPPATSGTNSP